MVYYYLPKRLQPFFYRGIKWYFRKERTVRKRGIEIQLLPSVFHPSLYLSTDILLDYVLNLDIENKSILELGCGNGFISIYLTKFKKVKMHASDINPKAIKGIQKNALKNNIKIEIYQSNLFDSIPKKQLDYILVNPPYFQKEITSNDEYAFFAGEDLEYFKKFFQQILPYIKHGTKVLMILSENVDLEQIRLLAKANNISLNIDFTTTKNREIFFIYSLSFLPL